MTKRERIDTAREARLWVSQIVVPGVTLATTLLMIPEVRQAVAWKAQSVKWAAERKMNEAKQKQKAKTVKYKVA